MRHSRFTLYVASILLCAAGILMAVVSDVWAGNAPLGPKASITASPSATPGSANSGSLQSIQPGSTALQGTITQGMSIFWVSKYTLCGHELVQEETVDQNAVGLTYAQYAARYPDCTMEIESGQVRMVRTYNQYCPDHYIIKSDDSGSIYVYRNMDGKDKLSMVMKMNFTTDQVPQDYRPLLKAGMAFGSVEEIEGLIEDAET